MSRHTDKANRPTPPDRDGDGNSGGSLPGNQTDEHAKGTADEALAEEQVAEDGLATIILRNIHTLTHPVGVNGHIRKLKVNAEVQVNAAELEVLEASHVDFETVIPLSAAGEAGSGGSSEPASD